MSLSQMRVTYSRWVGFSLASKQVPKVLWVVKFPSSRTLSICKFQVNTLTIFTKICKTCESFLVLRRTMCSSGWFKCQLWWTPPNFWSSLLKDTQISRLVDFWSSLLLQTYACITLETLIRVERRFSSLTFLAHLDLRFVSKKRTPPSWI